MVRRLPNARAPRYDPNMLIAIIPFLALVIGILIYVLASNSKLVEIGRAMFWTGMLVTLFVVANMLFVSADSEAIAMP